MGSRALMVGAPARKATIAQNLLAFDDLVREAGVTVSDLEPRPVARLLAAFSHLKDKRQRRKVVYPVQSLLVVVILSKLSCFGHNCCEIAGFAKSYRDVLREAGVLRDARTPSHDTVQRFLERLDTGWIRSLLARIKGFYREIQRLVPGKQRYTHVAVDGKEFRGSGRGKETRRPRRNTATLNIYDSSSGVCAYSIAIGEKTNEIPVARKKLGQLDLRHTIVTADALHCQTETARAIRNRRGDYVLCAKDNQDSLRAEIKSSFEKRKPKQEEPVFFQREGRKFWVIRLGGMYIGEDWPDQRLYIRMVSSTTGSEAEPMYFLTSLHDPVAAIEAIEVRWTVENALHKKKDFYCSEDKYLSTSESAIESMAYLNNLTVAMAGLAQAVMQEPRLKTVYQRFAADPLGMFQRVMGVVYHPDKLLALLRKKLEIKEAS